MPKRKRKVKRMDVREKDIEIQIKPQKGIEVSSKTILFGQTRKLIEKTLGMPNKKYFTLEGNERWQYFDMMIELSFEKENSFLLGWIEVYYKNAKLFSKQLIGLNKNTVLEKLNMSITSSPEVDDYGAFESYFFEGEWLELHFKFNRLTNINFGS